MPPKVNEFVAKALEKQLKQLTSTLVNHRCAADTGTVTAGESKASNRMKYVNECGQWCALKLTENHVSNILFVNL